MDGPSPKWKISAKKVWKEKIKLTDFCRGIHFTANAGSVAGRGDPRRSLNV
jgi:hypothetical protein